MSEKPITKYATIINNQILPSTDSVKWDWRYTNRAVSEASKGKDGTDWAYSYYSKVVKKKGKKTTTSYHVPETLTAHQFWLDIPENAYIDEVRFIANYKVGKGITVKAPYVKMMIYGGDGKVSNASSGKTGWHNGTYCCYPSTVLSTKGNTINYVISGAEWNKRKYPTKQLNQKIMGIDIYPQKPSKMTSRKVPIYLNWVKVKVTYTLPKTTLSYSIPTSQSEPYSCIVDNEFNLDVIIQQNKCDDGTKEVEFNIPWGTDVDGLTNPYQFRASPNKKDIIHLKVNPHGLGLKELEGTLKNVNYPQTDVTTPFYYYPLMFDDMDYFRSNITSTELRQGVLGCFTFSIVSESTSNSETFNIDFDYPLKFANISLDKEVSSNGVEIVSCTQSDDLKSFDVVCNVPTQSTNNIKFDLCGYPYKSGEQNVMISDYHDNEHYTYNYDVLPPYTYYLSNNPVEDDNRLYISALSELRKYESHHVPTEVDSKGIFLDCSFQDGDSVMIMKDNNLTAHYYEPIDYIGCVPLEHLHFDPKSTYKDTLIDTRYKNKRYVGKKLAVDEDISLNVRLHPQQVTTIQGLIDMDKPIPINANHKCFEGDALNHRGWVEIYSVKTEETNPSWYKCDIDVKYLTHNLNTRFHINRGIQSYPIDVPDMVAEVLTFDDNITDYFDITTDGTYSFREDYVEHDAVTGEDIEYTFDDNERHLFELESGQSLHISSKDKLSNRTNIIVDWSSAKLSEDKENQISRIFRIKDKTNTVFEYEYSDYDFSNDGYISCNVIGRQLMNGSYEPLVIDEIIDLRVDDEPDIDEDTGEVIVDNNDLYYGSTIHFELNNKHLRIIDEGFNGREIDVTLNDDLEGDTFYFETEIVNHNSDMESGEMASFLNFTVEDSILDTSRFYDKYDRMIVSPFPVSDNKTLLFIREAKEGIIYYYVENELEEFSFVVDPYYQYKNGTDLTANPNGMSVFNLNYGYNPVYIENGLVKLGFNRLDGSMYLSKWDNESKDYIEVSRFHLGNEKDVDLTYITDDKIVLSAGDSKFTIWRGHPYIMVNHSSENIYMDTESKRAWAEIVGNDESQYPVYYDLMNTNNMLPKEIGGHKIVSDNIIIDDTEEVAHLNLVLSAPNIIMSEEEAVFSLTGSADKIDTELLYSTEYDGYHDNIFGDIEYSIVADNTVVYPPYFIISNYGLNVSASVQDVDGKGIKDKSVKFYVNDVVVDTVLTDGNGNAECTVTSGTVKAIVDDEVSNILEVA